MFCLFVVMISAKTKYHILPCFTAHRSPFFVFYPAKRSSQHVFNPIIEHLFFLNLAVGSRGKWMGVCDLCKLKERESVVQPLLVSWPCCGLTNRRAWVQEPL